MGIVAALVVGSACSRPGAPAAELQPKAYGAALVSVSGEKQIAPVGSQLDQPFVVQVNDEKGAAVAGALVKFSGPAGVVFTPDRGLTGSDGQFTTNVVLGSMHGRYQIAASSSDKSGKAFDIRVEEIALSFQEMLGKQVSDRQCVRCHDSESTPERVSNQDNLKAKAHLFTDGAVLNAISDANLAAIISHGGAALGKSPEMPPYGATLSKAEIDALVALLRAMADPPYRPQGVTYASN
jgi:hypothetical protein